MICNPSLNKNPTEEKGLKDQRQNIPRNIANIINANKVVSNKNQGQNPVIIDT